MKRRISDRTLGTKIKKWQHILKLDGWTLTFKFIPPTTFKKMEKEKSILAMVNHASPNEKVAEMLFNNKYHTYDGFGASWNIDTLIIHELIHIHLFEKSDQLEKAIPEEVEEVFTQYEEFLCDSIAKIIYDLDLGEKKSIK